MDEKVWVMKRRRYRIVNYSWNLEATIVVIASHIFVMRKYTNADFAEGNAMAKKTYVYGMYADPDRHGTLIDFPTGTRELRWKHRGKIIIPIAYALSYPTARNLSNNAIELKIPYTERASIYTQSSRFIYVCNMNTLFVLDPATLQYLEPLHFGVPKILSIAGVHNGEITVVGKLKRINDNYLIAAKLPDGHVTRKDGFHWKAVYGKLSSRSSGELPMDKLSLKSSGTNEFESEFLKKFEPRRIVGKGSYGCVFKARNLIDKWPYAVKRIALRGSDEVVERALEEVCALASLRHEGIVGYNSSWIEKPPSGWQNKSDASLLKRMGVNEMFDYKDDSVFIYIQMELCTHTLRNWLSANKTRDLALTRSWFKQIVSAVAYLHQKNKIHRDLKPSNILFDGDGRLKICDLGLVVEREMRDGQEIDKTRTVSGTRIYMAPEQRIGFYTSKVDIFALGLILTELCVYMTYEKTDEVFINYQRGHPNTILGHLPKVCEVVSLMTNVDAIKRPTCEEILRHPFCQEELHQYSDYPPFLTFTSVSLRL